MSPLICKECNDFATFFYAIGCCWTDTFYFSIILSKLNLVDHALLDDKDI